MVYHKSTPTGFRLPHLQTCPQGTLQTMVCWILSSQNVKWYPRRCENLYCIQASLQVAATGAEGLTSDDTCPAVFCEGAPSLLLACFASSPPVLAAKLAARRAQYHVIHDAYQ